MAVSSAENTQKDIETSFKEANQLIEKAKTSDDVEHVRVSFLGKKGRFSAALSILGKLSPADRKLVGQKANQLKSQLEQSLEKRKRSLKSEEMEKNLLKDSLDATTPGCYFPEGQLHPIRQVMREAISILQHAGLSPIYGPEVEYEDFCFDRLNFKPGHPARDMQATFFVKGSDKEKALVLRTHTSPVQVRVLMDLAKKDHPLPIRVQAPGRVYRVDDDSTHSPMFHQIEGLAVDQTSGMGDLRATLDYFFRKFFDDKETKIRFRPSYFPFTEPSAEVDVSCVFCEGKGCKVCKGSGWLEIAGAGVVHPEVFKACGWDPEEVQGWAFGMGIERLAMLKLRIPDLRSFFENRLSFLRPEFKGGQDAS